MEESKVPKEIYADDATESVGFLLRLRLPWLLLGLVGGAFATIMVSRFEAVLSKDISLAFFIPIIVYMSDAVGTQTETIYVRNLGKGKINLHAYIIKELLQGISLGLILGALLWGFAYFWFQSPETAWTVGLAMFVNITIAPVLALLISSFLQKEHTDPAISAGPFTTLLQDVVSLAIYFVVATVIIF